MKIDASTKNDSTTTNQQNWALINLQKAALGMRFLTYYEILGVPPDANLNDIKAAFRQKAQAVHPDASGPEQQNTIEHWHQLLTSYQVLSDEKSRQLYDLSQRKSEHPWLRQAASSGLADGPQEHTIDLTWGIDSWLRHDPQSDGALDKVRAELQRDFHAALRHAYMGPSADDLQPGQLPESFEAEERSHTETPDLLQLVVGRQVIGAVKVRQAGLLSDTERQVLGIEQLTVKSLSIQQNVFPEEGNIDDEATINTLEIARGAAEISSRKELDGACKVNVEGERQEIIDETYAGEGAAWRDQVGDDGTGQDPEVLDVYFGEQQVATAIRALMHPETASQTTQDYKAATEATHQQATTPIDSDSPSNSRNDNEPSSSVCIKVLDTESGDLLASIHAAPDATAASAGRAPSSASILNPTGHITHTLYRSYSPLVRHLTFVSSTRIPHSTTSDSSSPNFRLPWPGGGGSSGTRVVARCHRAWLPASSLWLFKPRSWDHDIGGWSIEWVGHAKEGHPAGLDPRVLVAVAGFDSWDHEKRDRQPDGVFAAYRRKRDGAGSMREGDNGGKGGRVMEWLRDVLRFHGR